MEFLTNPSYKPYITISVLIVYLIAQKGLVVFIEFLFIKFSNKEQKSFTKEIFDNIKKPIYFFLTFLGLAMALKLWGGLPKEISEYIKPIMQTLFIFSISWIAYDLVIVIKKIFTKITNKFDKTMRNDLTLFITKTIRFFIFIITFIMILQVWGYNINGFLASLGLVGMAFALAAKDTASNLFGSLVIFSDRPFKIGDWITIPNVDGTVEEIGIRSTQVRTFSQAVVTIPNATLANSAVLNWTRMGKRRVKMNIELTYSTTSQQLRLIIEDLREMLKSHKDVNQDVIYVYFTDYNSSSLGIFCYYFTNSTVWGEYMRVKEDVNFKIMQIIEKHKASFAFPSQSLYIEKNAYKEDTILE